MKSKSELFASVNAHIISTLERDGPPWKQPWSDVPFPNRSTFPSQKAETIFDACEALIMNMPLPPAIRHEKDCLYNAHCDYVSLPRLKFFKSDLIYHLTLFHLVIRATGAPHRLDTAALLLQSGIGEEIHFLQGLVAELGACYLAVHVGVSLDELENNIGCVRRFLESLTGEKPNLAYAQKLGERAARYVLEGAVTEIDLQDVFKDVAVEGPVQMSKTHQHGRK